MNNSEWTSLETAAEKTGVPVKKIGLLILSGVVAEKVKPLREGGTRVVNLDQLKAHFNK